MPNLSFLMMASLLLLLAWLIPNHYLPWTAFYHEFLAATSLLLAATTTFWRKPWRGNVTVPRPTLILPLVALLPLLQLATGLIQFSGDAWIASLYLAGLMLAYITGYWMAVPDVSKRITYAMAWLFMLGALISLFFAAHQWLQTGRLGIWLADLAPGGRPYANLAQPNNLGTLFCLGLAALLYFRERTHLGITVTALLALLLLYGVALTGSRTPFLILGVIAGWVWWNKARLGLKTSPIQLFIAATVYALLWLLLPVAYDALYLGGGGASNAVDALAERMRSDLRFTIWHQLLDAALQKPLFGYGWGQVSFAQITVAAEYPQSIAVEHSHNFIIDLLLWNGIVLGGLLTITIAWWLLSRAKQCSTLEAWFSLLAIMVIATHGLLEFPLEYAYFLLPIGFCAGIVERTISARSYRVHASIPALIVFAGWFTVAWVFVEYQKVEDDFRHMRFESIGLEKKKPGHETVNSIILSQLVEYTRFARTEAREGMSEDDIRWMERVAHRYPHPPALFRYALALGLNHRHEQAALELARLQRLHPPIRYMEAAEGWRSLSAQYPTLENVILP